MNKWKRASIAVGLTAALILGPISTAFSQDDPEPQTATIWDSLATTTTTTAPTTVIAAGVAITVVMLTDRSDTTEAALETYMRENAAGLQHDLYIGGGESAQDLARIFRVPEGQGDAFARILYKNRHDLAPLTEPDQIDGLAASEFRRIIVDEMVGDPVLAAHL